MPRRYYAIAEKEEPGTCGGCAYFVRGWNGGFPAASGKCKKKPQTRQVFQSTRACKTHYKESKRR